MCFEISVKPTSEEMALAKNWIIASFGPETSVPPFSFRYGGQYSAGLLKTWNAERTSKVLDEFRIQHTLTYTDSKTDLEVRCIIVEYKDFPTIEWTLFFKNTGASDSPILSDIQALDIDIDFNPENRDDEFVLHHFAGGFAGPDAYRPYQTVMEPNTNKSFSAAGGRPTNKDMSYFNLEGKGEGVIVVVGWPGQWSAQFNCDENNPLTPFDKGDKVMHIIAGQELTHFTLHPGEEIRTPLIVLQFWKDRDWIDSQNVWRRWMMAHSMPKPYGNLPEPRVFGSSYRVYGEMVNANEENQIMFINRYLEENLKIEYWWMDAGWYPCGGNWGKTGTWEVDTERFPGGLRAISDYAHSKGIKTMVWFEPERVAASTWLTENHPEWILGGANGGLLNLGNPEARDWLTNHIDKLLTEQGIDVYRQDFNMDPLDYWRKNDAEDRQGITEIKHVTGYLAYWDELIRRHPNMLIDTCASGGRRNDLETLRRAVPLWRTDYQYEPVGEQCQTYGISFWIPYHGGGNVADAKAAYSGAGFTAVEPYAFWSTCYPSINCAIDMRVKEIDYATLRKLHNQRREIVSYYYGDFYPLTPYSLENNVWIAWQFNKPESGEGIVQAFRRQGSDVSGCQFRLRCLESNAQYELTNFDVPEKTRRRTERSEVMTGQELMEKGLDVYIMDCPGAVVIRYKQVKTPKEIKTQ
jgi:alpha-galactosidase